MTFRSLTNRPPRVFNPCGCHEATTYSRRVDENGIICLEATGKRDIYAHIQTFSSECSVYHIVDRVNRTGDVTPLYSMQGRYQDVSGIPTTLAGVLQFRLDAESNFRQLPHDIRERFNNNPHEFMANPKKLAAVIQEMSGSRSGTPAQAPAQTAASEAQ